jgi:hypothetical protein
MMLIVRSVESRLYIDVRRTGVKRPFTHVAKWNLSLEFGTWNLGPRWLSQER